MSANIKDDILCMNTSTRLSLRSRFKVWSATYVMYNTEPVNWFCVSCGSVAVSVAHPESVGFWAKPFRESRKHTAELRSAAQPPLHLDRRRHPATSATQRRSADSSVGDREERLSTGFFTRRHIYRMIAYDAPS